MQLNTFLLDPADAISIVETSEVFDFANVTAIDDEFLKIFIEEIDEQDGLEGALLRFHNYDKWRDQIYSAIANHIKTTDLEEMLELLLDDHKVRLICSCTPITQPCEVCQFVGSEVVF